MTLTNMRCQRGQGHQEKVIRDPKFTLLLAYVHDIDNMGRIIQDVQTAFMQLERREVLDMASMKAR